MSFLQIHDLIERIGNLLRAEERLTGVAYGLQPVQLHALRYLARCNRYSDTPAGVTDYLGLTKGTVSQTLLVLQRKGYIDKQPDLIDRRVVHLVVTDQGRNVLDAIQAGQLFSRALAELTDEQQAGLADNLTELLRLLQKNHGSRSFGVCHSCRFFQRDSTQDYRCGLTHEPLTEDDSGRICREHEALDGVIKKD
ncbi:MAG: MarR family winged helix-turn-helix transcriptional regulator [Candidatus Competibacteraceae bacterium]